MNGMKQFFGSAWIVGLVVVYCAEARGQATFAEPAKPGSQAGDAPAERSVLAVAPQAANDAKHPAQDFCQCVGEAESPAVEKIERALRGPLHSSGFDYVDTPLKDVAAALQDEYGIPIQLDTPALEDIGVNTDEPVTVNLRNISLRSAMRLFLKNLQLTYLIRDEVLMITTTQVAESQLKTCVYDVAGLDGERGSQMDAIVDTILSCVATDTWAKNGAGEAEIRAIKPGLLVISQTAAVHDEIHSLLEAIRKMRAVRSPAANATSAIAPHAADEVVTRSYTLQLNPTNDIDAMRSQVRELIVQSLPEEAWTGRLADGQAVTLTVFNDRIIVRQTPAVQEKVQKLLTDSGVATPATAVASVPGAMGGIGGGGGHGGGFFSPEMAGRYGAPGPAVPSVGGEGIAPEPAKAE
jgi:hypothetical protein